MKKGFTLIELLAVIVILAIIALIATPIILNIIEDAKEESYKRSIDMYGKASENAVAHYQMKESKKPINYNDIKEYIDYDGAEVICDDFVINYDGTVYLSECSVGGYLVENYSYGKLLAIKEGTLAYDVLSNYGGIDSIERLTTDWKEGTVSTNSKAASIKKTDAIYFADKYKFDIKTGEYSLDGNIVKATVEECRTGVKTCGKYTFQSSNQDFKSTLLYEVESFGLSQNDSPNYSYITAKSIYSQTLNNEFANDEIKGLYKATDDLGVSYYFKGDATNNYVKFAKGEFTKRQYYVWEYAGGGTQNHYYSDSCPYPNSQDAKFGCRLEEIKETIDLYWRIVRINGDGTIRLVYDGGFSYYDPVASYPSGIYNYRLAYEAVYEFYKRNLEQLYSKYLAGGIFCEDNRFLPGYYEEILVDNSYLLIGKKEVYSEAYLRNKNQMPLLTCVNGKTTNKIGLLSIDEAIITNNSNYGFTMTPGAILLNDYAEGDGLKYYFSTSGSLEYGATIPVSPVINLKADVKFTGDGGKETPYEIVME